MKRLEYVASGTAYMRLNSNEMDRPECIAQVNDMFSRIVHEKNNHDFSMLYNGYTERSIGPKLQRFKPSIKQIHADSGGLQIVTRGLQNTPEARASVYENQAKYASVGMSFDEIPIVATGGTSARVDTSGRYFDRENFDSYAIRTGQNVRAQIEKFVELDSQCKPFIIAQGADHDTYIRWAELLIEQIPEDHRDRIGGVALGSAALGMGSLEDAKRAFYVTHMPLPKPMHFHILGVGSLRRMLPFIAFIRNGLYDEIEVSYDSTTHTMSCDNGLFYRNGSPVKMGREYSNIYRTVTETINEVCELDYDPHELHKLLNTSISKFQEEGGDFIDIIRAKHAFILTNMHNFMKDVNSMMTDADAYYKFCRKAGLENEFAALENVKTMDDFLHWEKHVGKYLVSKPVSDEVPSTLDDLFA